MKSLKNKLFAIAFTIIAILSLSSCVEDDYIVRSGLYCDFLSITNNGGYFESDGGGDYTINDIPDIRNNSDILDMQYTGSELTITGNLRNGDYIRDLYIDVEGLKPFLFTKQIKVLRDNELILFDTYDDPEFYNFMNEAMRLLYRKGRVNIIVNGYVTDWKGIPISNVEMKVTLDNSLDIRVRG